jgi:hypothetical protein
MQGRVAGYLSTERRIPPGCRPASANDTHIVNTVGAQYVRPAYLKYVKKEFSKIKFLGLLSQSERRV